MFQVIALWNLARPDKDFRNLDKIEFRGYSPKTFLTGQFAAKIAAKEIKSLSTSDIADFLCPARRDLYIKKGKKRPARVHVRKTWGSIAGRVVENFSLNLFSMDNDDLHAYTDLRKRVSEISENFKTTNSADFGKLDGLKSRREEEPDWFFSLLTYNGRAELGFKLLHRALFRENDEMDARDVRITSCQLRPNPLQIGISSPVKPDFLIEKYNVVGDIKSGIGGLKDLYLLTCTGYALAFENAKGENNDINFGIIYFFPTRHSEYIRPVSFVQVYIFPIDDNLRNYFLQTRNAAYEIVSRDSPPDFPKDTSHCSYCHYFDFCISKGLKL
jgi:CRISPR/Cas system-associated exonuclease Cas4 (RecB family)